MVLGEQAIAQAHSLDQKVASTSANLASLSQQIQELLDSTAFVIPSEPSERRNLDLNKIATDSTSPRNDTLNLTPPDLLTASGSATLANLDITDTLSSLRSSTLDATISGTLKSLGESFLGQTEVTISNQFADADSIIIITPETLITQPLIVSEKAAGTAFVVRIATSQTQDVEFSYLIVGQEEARN